MVTSVNSADRVESQSTWYDSNWLKSYFKARAILKRVSEVKLAEFEEAMDVFRTPSDFEVCCLRNFLSESTQKEMQNIIEGLDNSLYEKHELLQFGRLVVHDHPYFTRLQKKYTELVSELVGEKVEPCYNFLSIYNNLAVCEPHLDAPFAKWTLDICIEQSAEWPIHISQVVPWPEERAVLSSDWKLQVKNAPELKFTPYVMDECDAILFGGSSQWHYRERIPRLQPQNFCHLIFLHFIPEGTRYLLEPSNWAKIFDVELLSEIALR